MSRLRGSASEDLDANIWGIWDHLDELNARLPGEPLIGTEEARAIIREWVKFSDEERVRNLFLLVLSICVRDKDLLEVMYRTVNLEYEPDDSDD